MIINMDDFKYTSLIVNGRTSYSLNNYIEKYGNIEELFDQCVVPHIISIYITQSRLLEIERLFAPEDIILVGCRFFKLSGWPELEEEIRKHSFWKIYYEKETRNLI